jgi:hypothetical protein
MSQQQKDRKRRYEKYLTTVRANTGGPNTPSPQPAMARVSSIAIAMHNAGYSTSTIAKTKRAAIQNGEVLQLRDSVGNKTVCIKDVESLCNVMGELNQDPDRYAITHKGLASLIREVEDA